MGTFPKKTKQYRTKFFFLSIIVFSRVSCKWNSAHPFTFTFGVTLKKNRRGNYREHSKYAVH